jgi:hypothetical protein
MSAPKYIDGYYGTPRRISRTPYDYPFRKTGDLVTKLYEATYLVDIGKFTPTASGTEDPLNSGHYLLTESVPDIFQGDIAIFRRVYSKIPTTQTVYDSLFIPKPELTGDFPQRIGDFLVVKPDETKAIYDAYTVESVSSESGAVSAASFFPTGGNYTLSFAGGTTGSLAYNAANSAVDTALDGLTAVSNRGGVAVTGAYNTTGLVATFASYVAATLDISSLTGSTGSTKTSSVTTSAGGYQQSVSIGLTLDAINPAITTNFGPTNANTTWTGLSTDQRAFTFSVGNTTSGTPATSGDFTLTLFGETTAAIAFGANAATIQAAVNALTAVSNRGGCTVTSGGFANGVQLWVVRIANPAYTAGTYTVTIAGGTTAGIAYSAGIATIQAALNLLSGVTNRGGCTVTGAGFANGVINFTIVFQNPTITANVASLTPAGATITVTPDAVGRVQTIVFGATTAARTLTVESGHGISSGNTIYVKADGVVYDSITDFTVVDAFTIALTSTSATAYMAATAITEVGKLTIDNYTPEPKQIRVKYVSEFYLPGVTPDIATADDIPLPTYQGDPTSLLAAIFSGETAINYQVGGLKPWRESAILERTITTLNASQL